MGGVHTARNAGISHSEGEYIFFLDSDDEIVPECLEILVNNWNQIPRKQRKYYWEVKAQCMDVNGNVTGKLFPKNINKWDIKKVRKWYSTLRGEYCSLRRGDLLRSHPWPEPNKIHFVREGIIWTILRGKYRSLFINDIVRVYHIENSDSISRQKGYDSDRLNSNMWNVWYELQNRGIYISSLKHFMSSLIRYNVYKNVLNIEGDPIYFKNKISREQSIISFCLWPFIKLLSICYIVKKN